MSTYLILRVTVTAHDLQRHQVGETRDAREAALKNYLETLGLRPRHGNGTMEFSEDFATGNRTFIQKIPS